MSYQSRQSQNNAYAIMQYGSQQPSLGYAQPQRSQRRQSSSSSKSSNKGKGGPSGNGNCCGRGCCPKGRALRSVGAGFF